MKYPVLIIDDQINRRKEGFLRLTKEISNLTPDFEIEPIFIEHPNELTIKNPKNYSAAIVDAVLDENWRDFNISKALKILGNEIPIALLSTRWDKTNAEQIDEALKKPNCRTFLHWRDIDPEGNGQIDYSVRAIASMVADHNNIDIHLKIKLGDPIRILHISDLQIGGIETKNLKLEANQCADTILEQWDENPPTFIAFTGDIAEHGIPSQYKIARQWIEYFIERLEFDNLPTNRILYVPGNHDVNLCLAAGSRIKIASDEESDSEKMILCNDIIHDELIDYAYAPFREFLSEICDCPFIDNSIHEKNFSWVESRYRHIGVIFYGINTAQPANAFTFPERQVSADALAKTGVVLKQIINNCNDTKPLIIGMSHHCPTSASGDNAVINPEVFTTFFKNREKTGLFLHGHVHENGLSYQSESGFRLVRSCASTFTKSEKARPADSLRGFTLLDLKRTKSEVTAMKARSFGRLGTEIQKIKEESYVKRTDGMFKEE